MLAVSVASAFTASLLLDKDCLVNEACTVAREPWLQDLLTASRHGIALGSVDSSACTEDVH